MIFPEKLCMVIRIYFFALAVKFFIHTVCNAKRIAPLFIIQLKSIALKKFIVIRWVIVHLVLRRMKSLHNQSPPTVALAKVDRAIHGFHSSLLQPLFAMVEHHERCGFAVDALKKTYAARGLLFFSCCFFINPYGYPAY